MKSGRFRVSDVSCGCVENGDRKALRDDARVGQLLGFQHA